MGADRSALADVLDLAEIEKQRWLPGLAALWASGTPMNAGDSDGGGEAGGESVASAADGGEAGGEDGAADDGAVGGDSDDEIAAQGKDPDKVKATISKLRAELKTARAEATKAKSSEQGDDLNEKVAELEKKLTETSLRADRAEVSREHDVPLDILQLVGGSDRDALEAAAKALKGWRSKAATSATDDLDGGAKPHPTTADDPASLAKGVSRGW